MSKSESERLYYIVDALCKGQANLLIEELHRGDVNPGLGAGNGGFEVFGKAAVAIELGEGALDNPAPGEDFEANGVRHAFDDFDAPAAEFGQCFE